MEKLYTSKTFLKMTGGRMYTPHPTPFGSAPGHKLQKPSKESGMFQSLGTISFVLFLLKARVKKRGHGTMAPSKYAPGHEHIGPIFLKYDFFIQYNISFLP